MSKKLYENFLNTDKNYKKRKLNEKREIAFKMNEDEYYGCLRCLLADEGYDIDDFELDWLTEEGMGTGTNPYKMCVYYIRDIEIIDIEEYANRFGFDVDDEEAILNHAEENAHSHKDGFFIVEK